MKRSRASKPRYRWFFWEERQIGLWAKSEDLAKWRAAPLDGWRHMACLPTKELLRLK
jgi:hypothetical protein